MAEKPKVDPMRLVVALAMSGLTDDEFGYVMASVERDRPQVEWRKLVDEFCKQKMRPWHRNN